MNLFNLIISMIILLFSILIHFFIKHYDKISFDLEKCPFCYGKNLCPKFNSNEIAFLNLTFADKLSNLINVKNVYLAHYNEKKVILKKLGHNWELGYIDQFICASQNFTDCPPFDAIGNKDFTNEIVTYLINDNKEIFMNLKICSLSGIDLFMNTLFAINTHLNVSFMTANIWTTILANAEPLLLQILDEKQGWPVPKYYGSCGRVIVEEFSGNTLNFIAEDPWINRAKVALELLKAADDFTHKHNLFRFYPTDISSDNIAVTEDYKVKFIDLENIIITEKKSQFDDTRRVHESQNFDCGNCYAFSADEICSSSISDHTYYSVCKLLLSKYSPWPMMTNGLLHSPPEDILKNHFNLFELIEICAESGEKLSRFQSSKLIKDILETIISKNSSYY